MYPRLSHIAFALAALAPLAGLADTTPAAQAASEARLRDALRTTTLQLRDVQGTLATAQSDLDTKTAEAAALKKKTESLAKQAAAERAESAKAVTALNDRITAKDARITQLETALEQWKAAANKAAGFGRATEAERARLAALSDRLTVRVADREAKNVRLIKLGNEILNRFEKYGLGEAIAGREPFIGVKRVELQNFAQDYSDKIADEKAKPGVPAAGESAVK